MPEHVHLLIYPRMENYAISDILKSIKQPVSYSIIQALKKCDSGMLEKLNTGRDKPPYRFWMDGGGYDRNYWEPDKIAIQIGYIHKNPVRRGLVAQPEDWKWSSAGCWLKGEEGPVRVNGEMLPLMK